MADLSFIGQQYPLRTQQQDIAEPSPVDAVSELLKSLETARPPEPHKLKTWQTVLGSLGDAIQAMAAVRAGGAPPALGPFAQRQYAQQQQYQQRVEDVDKFNRETQRMVRVGAFEESQRARREKDVAGIRANKTSPFIRDSYYGNDPRKDSPTFGQRIRITDFYDRYNPDQLVETRYGEESPFAPVVVPGLVNEPGQPPKARLLKIPKGKGETTVVPGPGGSTLEPQPPTGLVEETGGKIGVLAGIPHLREVFDKTDAQIRGTGEFDKWKNWAVAQTAGTRFQSVAMPAGLQNYYNEVRGILAPYVRSVSGLVFPDAELKRYEARMPIPGVTPPESVDTAWDSLIQEMVRDITAKYGAAGRKTPALPSGSNPNIPSGPSPELQQWLKQRNIEVTP